MTRIGFIGFGEAAFHISLGLHAEGAPRIKAYTRSAGAGPHGALVRQRVARAGVELQPSLQQLIEHSDVVLSLTTASAVTPLALESAKFLRRGQIYADLNSAAPATKAAAEATLAPSGALFVDGSVMGKLPGLDHKVPVFVSGTGAPALMEAMRPYGMNFTLVPGEAGQASLAKMLRSVFMKGVATLLLETVVAGRKHGMEDDLLASIAATMTAAPFLEVANGMLTRSLVHAGRRAHEMDEVVATLEGMGVDSTMSHATRSKLQMLAKLECGSQFGGGVPDDFHDVLSVIEEASRASCGEAR